MASSAAAAAVATSSEDEEFLYETANTGSHRYPVHDCCEFEDAESLKVSQSASRDKHHACDIDTAAMALHFGNLYWREDIFSSENL